MTKNEKLATFHRQALYSEEYQAWWIMGRLYGKSTLDYHKNITLLISEACCSALGRDQGHVDSVLTRLH